MKKVAAQYLKSSNRTVGLFIPTKTPERAPLPAQPDVVAMVKGYKGAGRRWRRARSSRRRSPTSRTRTERTSLPSGMKLALLSKKTRGNSVKIMLKLHTGTEADAQGPGLGDLALVPDMVQRGTKKHTYQQLRDELDKLKAELRTGQQGLSGGARPGDAIFTVTTVRESVPAVLALLGEIVQASRPSRRTSSRSCKKEKVTRLEDSLQQPQAIAFTTLISKAQPYAKDDVRYHADAQGGARAHSRRSSSSSSSACHKSFWGAGDAELVMVGDFDGAEVKKLAAAQFGTWKAAKPYKRLAMPYRAPSATDELIQTPDKQMAMIGIGGALPAP